MSFICTPPRFLWQPEEYFRGKEGLWKLLGPLLVRLRKRDLEAAAALDRFVAVSRHTAARIRAVYGRDATVIHPPVDCHRFLPLSERSGPFLVLSRLVLYAMTPGGTCPPKNSWPKAT